MRRSINIWKSIDWFSVALYLLLILLGWINIYAAVYNDEYQSIFDVSQRYGKQMIWMLAALVIIIVIFLIDVNFYVFFSYIIYGLVVLSLIAVLFVGKEVHGAKSWFSVAGFQIQPAEFAKFATTLAVARYLSSYNVNLNNFKTYFKVAAIIVIPPLLIILQNDWGSALVYSAFILVLYREGMSELVLLFGVFIIALFILTLLLPQLIVTGIIVGIAVIIFWIIHKHFREVGMGLLILAVFFAAFYGVREYYKPEFSLFYTAILAIVSSGLVFLIYALRARLRYIYFLLVFLFASLAFAQSVDYVFNNVLEQHQQKRINNLLGIESDLLGAGYNVNQSKIAIGSGGLAGKGFLKGTQTKFDFVPEQSTDFIFCTIGEEWGFLGTFFIIGLLVVFLLRLIYIAERQRSQFSRIYGYGVVAILFFHITVNIGMTIGLLPVIGIPLPFFSYGGSSLWGFTILLFILLRLDANRLEML